ncbi:hypothetical protein Tco_0158645 [Tanacetum coccineum]
MITYLKNMEGEELEQEISPGFGVRIDLVKGSSKRAGEELEQESTKKQKVDEDKDTAELQSLIEVILDEEEVVIDVVPLATKPPTIKRDIPLPPTITDLLNKKLQVDYFSEIAYQLLKLLTKIVGIKSLFNAVSITAALIDVNAAQLKLVLLENFNENYSKCLRLLVKLQLPYKVNAAEGVNAASEEVSTAELVSTAYYEYCTYDQMSVDWHTNSIATTRMVKSESEQLLSADYTV